ncbi:hypothetical protein COU76_02120 [Candidatus Peregrinibacteria bacterium CG10_big_fil_rev_8_21_14_0_10_49_10]|nr:MAG: hypothetical protein COU76_02120 [Candidatus Peregrinibacteria bacterium CG10_big_fil_rev_8_21_14_0_10_49_10]
MKIFLLANQWPGWKVAEFLAGQEEDEIVGLCLHKPNRQKGVEKIIAATGLPPERIYTAPDLRDPEKLQEIQALGADICIAAFWYYILKPDFLALFPHGTINFHPGYLPYNRGMNPDVWPFVDGSPAGVTLHYIDEEVDTGDIVAQRKVELEPVDNDKSLYNKTLREIVDLFKDTWPIIRTGNVQPVKQDDSIATKHKEEDRYIIEKLNLDAPTTGRKFLDLLRGRTFRPYPSCYFEENGKKVYVRAELCYEEDAEWNGGKGKWDYTEDLE